MTKKRNLSAALSDFDRRPPIVKAVEVKQEKNKETEQKNSFIPLSRRGKKANTNYFAPEVIKQLKLIALEEDKSMQGLMEEAVNELFKKYGKPHIA